MSLSTTKPETFDAAFRDAMAAHQSGHFADAAARYQALLPAAPRDAQLRYLLGAATIELDRFDEAIENLERANTLRPHHLPTVEMLASAFSRAGALDRALPHLREAERLAPNAPETISRLANGLRLAGEYAEARDAFRRLLAHVPTHRQSLVGLARCLEHLGETAEAEALVRTCLAHHPDYGPAHTTLASIFGQTERFADAERSLKAFLAKDPSYLEARKLLATAVHKQGRLEEAVGIYREILRDAPGEAQMSLQLAEGLIDLSRLDDAEQILDALRRATPRHAGVITGLGRIQELRGNLDAAVALHTEAIACDPASENAFLNRGSAKRFAGAYDEALADYDAALTLRPGFPPAVANRGLTLLILGRLAEAWPHYRSRIKALPGAPDLSAGKPWDGSRLAGKRVLVWLEYGLGDEILFANLLPELIEVVAHCTIVCSPRLCTLFARSFPRAAVVPMGAEVADDFDVRLPLTDVAQWLRPGLSSFPQHDGYLAPDRTLVEELRGRYLKDGATRLVGLSWRSASGPTGRFKSMDLTAWENLLTLPGAAFVSLQYGDCDDDIARARATTGREVIQDRSIESSGDMDRFAAQVAAMDLVISVSNTTVHVAGGLGRPVWILVPKGPGAHWYWFLNRADSPWYPSARLFRQERPGAWEKPLEDIAGALGAWLES